jgi:hypothetical protein
VQEFINTGLVQNFDSWNLLEDGKADGFFALVHLISGYRKSLRNSSRSYPSTRNTILESSRWQSKTVSRHSRRSKEKAMHMKFSRRGDDGHMLVHNDYTILFLSLKVVCWCVELDASGNEVQVSLPLGCDPPAPLGSVQHFCHGAGKCLRGGGGKASNTS